MELHSLRPRTLPVRKIPARAIEYGARQLLTPIEQRIQAIEARAQEEREFFSRRDAEKEHGPEVPVRAAYNGWAQGTFKLAS